MDIFTGLINAAIAGGSFQMKKRSETEWVLQVKVFKNIWYTLCTYDQSVPVEQPKPVEKARPKLTLVSA